MIDDLEVEIVLFDERRLEKEQFKKCLTTIYNPTGRIKRKAGFSKTFE